MRKSCFSSLFIFDFSFSIFHFSFSVPSFITLLDPRGECQNEA